MRDLEYIIGIGFSGADLPRALILAFFFAMFAKKSTNIWKMALLALLIDKIAWPIAAMGASGAGFHAVYASIAALFKGFFDDLGIYIVRYLGLVLLIGGFRWLRSRIHHAAPNKHATA